jgi:restriction system protein
VEYFVTRVVLPAIGKIRIDGSVYADIAGLVEHIAGEQPDSIANYSWEQLPETSPEQFEAFCAEILRRQGWEIRLTKRSGDQGIDIVAQRGGITVVFQCKMYTGSVGNKAVQEVHAGKDFLCADLAVVVSTAEFTPSARELANALDVILLHYSQLEEFDKILFGRRAKPEK